MKKRFSKRMSLICLLLVAVMLFSACSQQSNTSSSSQSGSQSESSSEEVTVHKLKLMGKSPDTDIIKWDQKEEFPGWNLFVEELAKLNIELEYEVIMPDQYDVVL